MSHAIHSLAIGLVLAETTAGCDPTSRCPMDAGDAAAVDATGDAPLDHEAGDAAASDAMSDGSPVDVAIGDHLPVDGATDSAESGAPDSSTTLAGLRIANWSADAPAVDYCFAMHGTGVFQGPVLANRAGQGTDAGTGPPSLACADPKSTAICFPQVSSYLYLSSGQYDVRIVVAGAPDCSAGIAGDATMLAALMPGSLETVALLGEARPVGADPGLTINGFLDDLRATGAVALRFIQAAPAVAKADMGMEIGGSFRAFFTGVSFGHASVQSGAASDAAAPAPDASTNAVDMNGYSSMAALSQATLSARPTGSAQDSATAVGVSAASGSVLTIVLVGQSTGPSVNDAGVPQGQLVECVDNGPTGTPHAHCEIISQ